MPAGPGSFSPRTLGCTSKHRRKHTPPAFSRQCGSRWVCRGECELEVAERGQHTGPGLKEDRMNSLWSGSPSRLLRGVEGQNCLQE